MLIAMTDLDTATPPKRRSAIANGRAIAHVDGRSATNRRMAELIRDFGTQIEERTPTSDVLLRRLASTIVQSEMLDTDMALGIATDPKVMLQTTETISKLLRLLGLIGPPSATSSPRRKRGAEPTTLEEYIVAVERGEIIPDLNQPPDGAKYRSPTRTFGLFDDRPAADSTDQDVTGSRGGGMRRVSRSVAIG